MYKARDTRLDRFVAIKILTGRKAFEGKSQASTSLVVVQHFDEELKRLVPTK